MVKHFRVVWVLSLCLIFSCSAHNKAKDATGIREITDRQEEASPYVLGSGDEITINVWRHDDLKRTVRIDPSGNIYLPLAGEIRASDLTISQLREELSLRLSKFLVDPQVDISLSTLRSQQVHVLGEVKTPGSFSLERKLFVWEAISKAGGFTTDANQEKVLLVRSEDDVATVTALDLNIKGMLKKGKLDRNVYLKNGDVIYVPPSLIVDIERFMKRVDNILRPFVSIERGIVLGDEIANILAGKPAQRAIIVPP